MTEQKTYTDMDFDLYQLFQKVIKYENKVEEIRMELADRPDFDPLQCYVELHRPRNKDLSYKHFQIYFDSKNISYMQRDLDYLMLNYSDKNDYKMRENNFYDIIVTHTDFMSCQIILGRQKKVFSAIIGTMHFRTQDLFTDLLRRELDWYRQVEKAKMMLFDKHKFEIFKHYLFVKSPLRFSELLDFMTHMRIHEEQEHQKQAEIQAKIENSQETEMQSKIGTQNQEKTENKQKTEIQFNIENPAQTVNKKNIEQLSVSLSEKQKAEVLGNTEALWRRMYQNNRKKYVNKTFSRLREFVVPQDYFENAHVDKQKLEFNQDEYFDNEYENFQVYTTIGKRGQKKINSYVEGNNNNPWNSSEHLPINLKFYNNLYDQKTNQGDNFAKEFADFHKRQLRQSQFI